MSRYPAQDDVSDDDGEEINYEDWEDYTQEEYFDNPRDTENLIQELDFNQDTLELSRRRDLDYPIDGTYQDSPEPVEPSNEDLAVDLEEM